MVIKIYSLYFFTISKTPKWILRKNVLYISCVGALSEKETKQKFGASKEFVESATHALEETTFSLFKSLDLEAASEVASCDYEYNTAWGKEVRDRNNIEYHLRRLVYVVFICHFV